MVNFQKDIVLMTHLRIFCTTLFTNNNKKVVIQMHTFLMDLICESMKSAKANKNQETFNIVRLLQILHVRMVQSL